MKEHPDHETLLRYRFDLLDRAGRVSVAGHVERCSRCRAFLEQNGIQAAAHPARPPERTLPSGHRFGSAFRSPVTPVVIMVASTAAAALVTGLSSSAALFPLVAGAALVIVWLHVVLSRLDSRLRAIQPAALREALPAEPDEKARFVEGMRLSVTQAIKTTRTHVNIVLFAAMALAAAGTAALLVTGMSTPIPPAALPSRAFFVILVAVACGLFAAGAVWSVVRLKRLRKTAGEVFAALLNQAAGPAN